MQNLQRPSSIWCVGRNYGAHAKELGNATPVAAGDPIIFLKAGASAQLTGEVLHLPKWSNNIHPEVEVVFRFGSDLKPDAVTIGLDLTARDAQDRIKKEALPWTLAKSFKEACCFGPWTPLQQVNMHLQEIEFFLEVNGERRQSGNTAEMIFSVDTILTYLLDRFPVSPGDVLFTGTPAGVGTCIAGDVLTASIPGLVTSTWKLA